MLMTKLSKYPHVQATHVYCDGSANDSRSGCELFICKYISVSHYTDTEASSGSLQTCSPLRQNFRLYALQSNSPMDCESS
ncbi:hypothetical protein E2C01_055811 [Portunus trituberculatus]|uniref:Uncharacterized protein n=1 Tax=Portunus trituberculatus TaxID=210409 RepID=A0A5B7GVR5_PORTR|nr:hypothetical protein [Portunus trituberculatus]